MMLYGNSLSWWLLALGGIAIVIGLGFGLWHTKLVKLLRAIRLENRGMRLLWAGYPDRAEMLLLRSLRLAEAADGPEGPEVDTLNHLNVAHQALESWEDDYMAACARRHSALDWPGLRALAHKAK